MCILCYVKCSEGVCALFPWHAVSDSLSRVQTASKRSWMRRKLGSAFNSLSALPITIRSRSTRCWQTFSSPLALFTKSCHQDRNLLQAAVASSDLTGMSHSAVFGFYIYHVFLQRHVGVQLRWCCQVPQGVGCWLLSACASWSGNLWRAQSAAWKTKPVENEAEELNLDPMGPCHGLNL